VVLLMLAPQAKKVFFYFLSHVGSVVGGRGKKTRTYARGGERGMIMLRQGDF